MIPDDNTTSITEIISLLCLAVLLEDDCRERSEVLRRLDEAHDGLLDELCCRDQPMARSRKLTNLVHGIVSSEIMAYNLR